MNTNGFDPDAAAGDGSGIYGLPTMPEEAHVVIVPVPFEATTSYGGGTSEGPAAILEASRQVDLFDRDTGRPYQSGIAMLPLEQQIIDWNSEASELAMPIIEVGGIIDGDEVLEAKLARVNEIGEQLNEWVAWRVGELLDQGKMAVTLGGDHAVPFGSIRAHAERFPGMGILHLDAHADLREAYEGFTWSHASIFHNVMTKIEGVSKLVQVGVRDLSNRENEMVAASGGRIVTWFDSDLAIRRDDGIPFARTAHDIVSELPNDVYLSWDIDGLDPTLCPSTGTPVPGGLSWNEAVGLLRALVKAKKRIVGFDLCEVAPGADEWDANVGARLLYKMIGFALKSNGI
ncbi:MAG: agmatinase family protein [Thermoanaerobaculia bacterium]